MRSNDLSDGKQAHESDYLLAKIFMKRKKIALLTSSVLPCAHITYLCVLHLFLMRNQIHHQSMLLIPTHIRKLILIVTGHILLFL